MIHRSRLSNGLVLLAEPLHEAPVVALQAWVDVGAADEDDLIAGIAHLHEHMLFKGTKKRGVGEIARTVETAGGEINAWTSHDQTVYHVILSAAELATGLDVLADALENSTFDADELGREIEVVVEEIKRADDTPSRRVSNAMFAQAFPNHPYRRPVLGSEATVRGLTRERIVRFYERNYRPEAMTLVAVGDFTIEEITAQAEKAFGGFTRPGASEKAPRPTDSAPASAAVRVLREAVKEARVTLGWRIPGLKHADTAAIDALSIVLGHGDSSRLHVETRRNQKLVNDVYAYAYTPRDPGLFMVGAGHTTGNTVAAATSLLDEVFRTREHLVSTDELDKTKVIILSEAAYQRETVQGESRRLGFFETVAGDHAYEAVYRAAIASLTPEDLRRVAQTYLGAYPSIIVQVPSDDVADYESILVPRVAERLARSRGHVKTTTKHGELTRLVLDNGATILVRPTDAPVVALRAVAYGGLRWENEATAGLGGLYGALLGSATQELGAEALAKRVALLGGSLSAFTGRNTIGMRAEFIRERAEPGLQLFIDAIMRPAFHAQDLDRERAVMLERAKAREDNPAAMAFELFSEALYPTHPYRLRLGGTEQSLPRLTLDDVTAYHRNYLTPDKLVVAVVGGIDGSRTLDALVRAFEEGKGAPLPAAPAADPRPSQPLRRQLELAKKQSHVVVGSMSTTLHDEDRFTLEVLTTVLSGQSGRLFLDLRDRQSLAYSVSASSLEGLDPGHVLVHMGTSPEKVQQALAGLYGHLDRLREELVSEEELARAQRYLIGTHAIDLQRSGARAMLSALGERLGHGYEDYLRYPERIRRITREHVREVAAQYLDPRGLLEVVVGPKV